MRRETSKQKAAAIQLTGDVEVAIDEQWTVR